MTNNTYGKVGTYSAQQQAAPLTDREIDSKALLSTAGRLQRTLDAKGADMAEYKAAVRYNQRLWTMFQVALCDPENPLPDDLKLTKFQSFPQLWKDSVQMCGAIEALLISWVMSVSGLIFVAWVIPAGWASERRRHRSGGQYCC